MMRLIPRPRTVLVFGLGALVVPMVEAATYLTLGRHPLDPTTRRKP